jgi:hypothetical protein
MKKDALKNQVSRSTEIIQKKGGRVVSQPAPVSVENIKEYDAFSSLLNIKPEILEAVIEDMKKNGYDNSQPVILWNKNEQDSDILIDGHTRKRAAQAAGLSQIQAVYVELENDLDAIQYIRSLQYDRRNAPESQNFAFLEQLSEYEKKNNVGLFQDEGGNIKKLNKAIVASLFHVSTGTATKYINVLKRGTEETKGLVRSGDLSINKADQETPGKFEKAPPEPEENRPANTEQTPETYEPGRGPLPRKQENFIEDGEQTEENGADINTEIKEETTFYIKNVQGILDGTQKPKHLHYFLENLFVDIGLFVDLLNAETAKGVKIKYNELLKELKEIGI